MSFLLNFILSYFLLFINLSTSNKDIPQLICLSPCLKCEIDSPYICLICEDNLTLIDGKCYSSQCSQFEFCSLCNNNNCIECQPEHKLIEGKCEITIRKIYSFYKLGTLLILILITLTIIIILTVYLIKKKRSKKIKLQEVYTQSATVVNKNVLINESHKESSINLDATNPQTNKIDNNYFHVGIKNNEINQDNKVPALIEMDSKSNLKELNKEKESLIENNAPKVQCVFCGKDTIFMKIDCKCFVCYEHCNKIKKYQIGISGENLKCPKHNIEIFTLIDFNDERPFEYKLRNDNKCEICAKDEGTTSFPNCKCSAKICHQCYDDNTSLYQYYKCPFCLVKTE